MLAGDMAGCCLASWHGNDCSSGHRGAAGARASPTPAVPEAEVIITMLTDAAAVHEVAAELRPGRVLVEMSTIRPVAVRELRVPDSVIVGDAPVLGSVAAVRSGQLTVLAGGDVERARPVLGSLRSVRHCGELGGGAAKDLELVLGLTSPLVLRAVPAQDADLGTIVREATA